MQNTLQPFPGMGSGKMKLKAVLGDRMEAKAAIYLSEVLELACPSGVWQHPFPVLPGNQRGVSGRPHLRGPPALEG